MKHKNFILGCLILAAGFFGGIAIERDSSVSSIDSLVFERDSVQGRLDHLQYNVDWNAMYNFRLKEITDECTKCSAAFLPVKVALDVEKSNRGKLVVPDRNPVTKRQE